ncbi:alpha-tocopherol transfer protein-like isoform X2 [Bemisia tabaci]|nr:PREDICTED: alpha-tocopherol transfer protein-like [Bemisia tabaci]
MEVRERSLSEEDRKDLEIWMSNHLRLPFRLTDEQLDIFLHCCYNDLDLVKKTIPKYFNMRITTPEFFRGRNFDLPGLKHIQHVIKVSILPQKTPKGYSVLMGRLSKTEVSEFFLDDSIKLKLMVIDQFLRDHGPSNGMVFLFDMTGVSFSHLSRISLSSVKKYCQYIQEAMPIRLKAIHVINANSVMTSIMTLLRPFIYKQHLKRIHLHSSDKIKEIYESVPQNILPKDYGGEEASFDTMSRESVERLKKNYEAFETEDKTYDLLATTPEFSKAGNKSSKKSSKKQQEDVQITFKKLELD